MLYNNILEGYIRLVILMEDYCGGISNPMGLIENLLDIGIALSTEKDHNRLLEMILTDWGCQPVVAATADKALEILVAGKLTPDVILADLHLHEPGAGVEAIRAVRAHTGAPAPAFLFTGDTEVPGGCGLGLEFLVLRKPLDPLRLRSMLADALGR